MIDLVSRVARKTISGDDLLLLAGAKDSMLWQAFEQQLKTDLEQLEKEVRERGQISDLDFSQDFRYKLGEITILKKILALPQEAKRLCEGAANQ